MICRWQLVRKIQQGTVSFHGKGMLALAGTFAAVMQYKYNTLALLAWVSCLNFLSKVSFAADRRPNTFFVKSHAHRIAKHNALVHKVRS